MLFEFIALCFIGLWLWTMTRPRVMAMLQKVDAGNMNEIERLEKKLADLKMGPNEILARNIGHMTHRGPTGVLRVRGRSEVPIEEEEEDEMIAEINRVYNETPPGFQYKRAMRDYKIQGCTSIHKIAKRMAPIFRNVRENAYHKNQVPLSLHVTPGEVPGDYTIRVESIGITLPSMINTDDS